MIEKFCQCGSNKIWRSRTKEHGYLCKSCWATLIRTSEVISAPKRHAKIKVVSDKQAKRLSAFRVVRDAYMALHPVCEYPGCYEQATDLHHGAGRRGNLLTDTRYFKALCRKCHIHCEENVYIAIRLGLSFSRLDK